MKSCRLVYLKGEGNECVEFNTGIHNHNYAMREFNSLLEERVCFCSRVAHRTHAHEQVPQEQHDDSAPGGELRATGCDPKCQLDARASDGEFVSFMERNLRCEGAFSAADVKPAGGGGGGEDHRSLPFRALAFKEARRCEMEDYWLPSCLVNSMIESSDNKFTRVRRSD